MNLRSLFQRNMNDPRERYMHYDGSSAYADGLLRLSQRTDVRVGLALTFGLAAVHSGVASDASALKNVASFAGGALGAGLSVAFNTAVGHLVQKASLFPRAHEDEKVYDRTGEARTVHHANEIYVARSTLAETTVGALAIAGVLGMVYALGAKAGLQGTSDILMGFMNTQFAKLALTPYRNWQIKNEIISRADDIPPLAKPAVLRPVSA